MGFIFSLPDALPARRGQAIDTVIVKTVAVLPERACAGLGGFLVGHSHVVAHRLGYRQQAGRIDLLLGRMADTFPVGGGEEIAAGASRSFAPAG